MMISKGSVNTLVQVTAVDDVTRVLTFADGDSLRLNQSGAEKGTPGGPQRGRPGR